MSFYTEPFKAVARDPDGDFMAPRVVVRLRDGENRITKSSLITDAAWTKEYCLTVATGTSPVNFASSIKLTRANSAAVEAFVTSPASGTLREAQGRYLLGVWCVQYFNHPDFRLALVSGTPTEYYANFTWGAGGTTPVVTAQHAAVTTVTVTDVGGGWFLVVLGIDATTQALHNLTWKCRTWPAYGTTNPSGIGLYQANAGVEQQAAPVAAGTITVTTDAVLINQPGTLVVLTDIEEIITMNPVRTEREWVDGGGGMVAQSAQVELTNDERLADRMDLGGAWLAIQGTFDDHGLRELLVQGRVRRASMTSNGTLTLDIQDQIQEALGQTFVRDTALTSTGWAGNVRQVAVASGSSAYNNDWDNDDVDEGVEAILPGALTDATFEIEFTTATAFKVILPDGTQQTGFSVVADANVTISGGGPTMLRIKAAGWSGGTFAAGDKFKFATARPWTNLTPLYVAFYLMNDQMKLRPYDVLGGQWYNYAVDNITAWQAAMFNYTSSTVGGVFDEGTDVMEIVSKLLMIIHANIYSTPTGQMGLYELLPNTQSAYLLNGDGGTGLPVDLVEPPGIIENMDLLANAVTFRYLSLLGAEASVLREDAASQDSNGRADLERDVRPVRVDAGTIEAACSKLLNRRKDARRTYTMRTQLSGAVLDINQPVALKDSMAGLNLTKVEIAAKEMDVMANEATLEAYVDPVTLVGYARVGNAHTTPPGSVVGGTDKVW